MASEKPTKREIPRAYQTGRRSSSYSSGSYRFSSGKDGSAGASDSGWPWDRYSVMAARALVLISLFYAAWRFGATDSAGHFHLSIMLGVAAILTLTARRSFTRKSRRLPVFVFTLGLLWIGYAGIQSMPVVAPLGLIFSGQSSIKTRFAEPAVDRLESAIKRLDESQIPSRFGNHASMDPYQTRDALVPFLLAFAVMVLTAILFETRQARIIYLWALIANTSLLAAWGIIQRAGQDAYILPGIENTYTNSPFSSFIYKNAGAAALLPGIAAIAALLYGQRNKNSTSSTSYLAEKSIEKANLTFLLQPRTLTLLALAGLLTVGLLASLSRGAWVAAIVAFAITFSASRVKISRWQAAVSAVSLVSLIASVIALTGIRETVSDRARQVTVANASGNQRWEYWKDGAAAACYYAPGGSGLGTYGYASLPTQSSPRSYWFREAHNQYLEVLVESGAIGIVVMLTAVGWFGFTAWRLLRQDEQREKSSWGLLGIFVLVCGATQSVVDFVLTIPANMLLYASVIGVVAATERSYVADLRSHANKPSITGESKDPIRMTELRYSLYRMPAIWCLIGLGFVFIGGFHAYRNSRCDLILDTVRNSTAEEQPTIDTIDKNLSLLGQAIELKPNRANLYRRRAAWNFMKYRSQLIDITEAQGEKIAWDDTRWESVGSTIAALEEPTRQQFVDRLLATPELRIPIIKTLGDLSRSLQRNPLDPVTHISCLFLSPLTGMDVEPWIASTTALNKNDARMLYSTGLVAFQHDLFDTAIDQWSQSVSISQRYVEDVYVIARTKLTSEQIARNLVPGDRTDLLVRLVIDADKDSPMLGADVAEELVKFLQDDNLFEQGPKEAALGGIFQVLGDKKQAIRHWEEAVRCTPRSVPYRWTLAELLRQNGELDRALQYSILGESLHPGDNRFTKLTARIRQDIRLQRNFK